MDATIFWITRLDSIKDILSVLIALSIAVIFIWTIAFHTSESKKTTQLSKLWLKWAIPISVLLILLYILTPSTIDACVMYNVDPKIIYNL